MKRIQSGADIVIELPETLEIEELVVSTGARRRSGDPATMASGAPGDVTDTLIDALRDQGLNVDKAYAVVAGTPSAGARRRAPGDTGGVRFDVQVAPGEDAVILIERDGAYSWVFPTDPPGLAARRRGAAPATRSFEIDLGTQPPTGAPSRRSVVSNFIIGRIRAFVLRFVAQAATDVAMAFLERDVRRGLVTMQGTPDEWSPTPSGIGGDQQQAAKVLLFLHGTFSTTRASFAAFGSTKAGGPAFLNAAAQAYDRVIGFDHPTLSVDPGSNADDLLEALEALAGDRALHIDMVGFSRGGLVGRALAQRLGGNPKIQLGKTFFVAVPNAGTTLAAPENWHRLVDLYTNIAMAALRLLQSLPGAIAASTIAKELVTSLGAFVRFLTSHALGADSDVGAVPGLAAMRPGSSFISGLTLPAAGDRHAVVAGYEPPGRIDLAGLPRAVLDLIADGVIDDLLGNDNDLVVNTDSMVNFGDGSTIPADHLLDFGVSSEIYHTIYFARPEVVAALSGWLGLGQGQLEAMAGDRRTTQAMAPEAVMAEKKSENLVVVAATEPLRKVLELNVPGGPDFVVIQNSRGHSYALRPSEVAQIANKLTLDQALVLREVTASRSMSEPDPTFAAPMRRSGPASRFRGVEMDAGAPAAVVYKEFETAEAKAPDTSAPVLESFGARRGPSTDSREFDFDPDPSPQQVDCHFRAELDEKIVVGKTSTLAVTISREMIDQALRRSATHADAAAKVIEGAMLIVEVWPDVNLDVAGDKRAEIAVPAAGSKPQKAFFDVRPPALGPVEVTVIIRQGPRPLAELQLKAEAIALPPQTASKSSVIAAAQTSQGRRDEINQLRIFGGLDDNSLRFEYEISLPGIIMQRFVSEPVGKRSEYTAGLYRKIESSYARTKQDADNFRIALRSMGDDLFRNLLPLGLQHLLWQYKDEITSIQVISREPFIPWELVFISNPNESGQSDDGKFMAEMGLTRWLYGNWPPDEMVVRPKRARYIQPEYPDPLPEADAEAAFLRSHFGATAVPLTLTDIYALLREGKFDLLHFVCHGEANQAEIWDSALLISKRGATKWETARLDPASVKGYGRLKGADGSRPLVMLNACQTGREGFQLTGIGGFAPAFLQAGAAAFVGTLWSVIDRPARVFAEAFYGALLSGHTLASAATEARRASSEVEPSSWLAYAVYGDPQALLTLKEAEATDS